MTTHELANLLLTMKNVPVVFGVDDWVYPVEGAAEPGRYGEYELAAYLHMVDGHAQVIT
jgi:hypothetical protein